MTASLDLGGGLGGGGGGLRTEQGDGARTTLRDADVGVDRDGVRVDLHQAVGDRRAAADPGSGPARKDANADTEEATEREIAVPETQKYRALSKKTIILPSSSFLPLFIEVG